MKIGIIVAGIALFVSGCASDGHLKNSKESSKMGKGGFRGLAWGTDKAEVEKEEKKGSPVGGSPAGQLIYDGKLLGKIPVKIFYHFEDGKLRRGTYQVIKPKSVMEYTLFRIILVRKYGRPHQDARTATMAETIWLTTETEIDLLADGAELMRYSLEDPESSRSIDLSALKINYYDRIWFGRSIEQTEKEEAEDRQTQTFYQKLIGDWVQVFPSYRSCIGYDPFLFPGYPMFLTEDEYEYEPGSSDSDF